MSLIPLIHAVGVSPYMECLVPPTRVEHLKYAPCGEGGSADSKVTMQHRLYKAVMIL